MLRCTRRCIPVQFAFLLYLALAPLHARAEDAPEAEDVAPKVRAAVAAGDTAKLKVLAASKKPDPWLVADWLVEEGDIDAAIAFAEASDRPGTRGIADYARARQGTPKTPAATRAALRAARTSLEARDYKGIVKALEGVPTDAFSAVSAQVLFARGMGYWGLSRFDDAAQTLDAALEQAQSLSWLNLQSYILGWAAATASRRRDPRRSLALARTRVDLETTWGRKKQLAAGLIELALAQTETGDGREGQRSLERSLAVSRDRKDELAVRSALFHLIRICVKIREHTAAALYAREALDDALRRENRSLTIQALMALGATLLDASEVARARSYLERAASLARLETTPALLGSTLGHLGTCYVALGEFPKALTAYEEALRIKKQAREVREVAFVQANLAALYHKMGQPEIAREKLEEAHKIFQAEGYVHGIASTAKSLAELAMGRGDLDVAERLLRTAMGLYAAAWNRHGEASVTASLASLASHRKKFDESASLYKRALAIYLQLSDRALASSVRASLGWILVLQGRPEEGIKLIEGAVEYAHSQRDVPTLVELKGHLAYVFLLQGKNARAMQLAAEALDHRENLLGGLGDEDALLARAHLNSPTEIGALAAARVGDAARALHFLEAGRAGNLLESLGGRDALQWADLPRELLEAEQRARRAQSAAAAEYRRAASGPELKAGRKAREALDRATLEMRNTVARIQREAKAQAGLYYPRPATLQRVQDILDPSEVIVLYGAALEEAIAIVISKRSARVARLGQSAPINAACEAFRSMSPEIDTAPALKTLTDLLVKPLKLGAASKNLIFSPQGALTHVPPALLFKQTTSTTPSATTLTLLRSEPLAAGQGVLALGDPEYGTVAAAPTKLYVRGGALTPLPGTRTEVEAVGDVVLVGEKATEAGLRREIAKHKRWRSVHFACHGLVNHDLPTLCALALTPTEEDDGFLTALEVFRQQIPTDLAVLSACETGNGTAARGEGLIGLVRAFMYAGAPRVIASLWKVDDEATRELMLKFYELWNGETGLSERSKSPLASGEPKPLGAAAALKRAQAFVRDHPDHPEWKHPYYWAAWTLWGLPH